VHPSSSFPSLRVRADQRRIERSVVLAVIMTPSARMPTMPIGLELGRDAEGQHVGKMVITLARD